MLKHDIQLAILLDTHCRPEGIKDAGWRTRTKTGQAEGKCVESLCPSCERLSCLANPWNSYLLQWSHQAVLERPYTGLCL